MSNSVFTQVLASLYPGRYLKQADQDTSRDNKPQTEFNSPAHKRKIHAIYAAAKNRMVPGWLRSNTPQKAETGIHKLPAEAMLQVLSHVMDDEDQAENARQLTKIRTLNKGFRNFLDDPKFDLRSKYPPYVQAQNTWSSHWSSLKSKTEKYSSEEQRIVRTLGKNANRLEDNQKEEWLTNLEQRMSSYEDNPDADFNTHILLASSGYFLKRAGEKDREWILGAMNRLNAEGLLTVLGGMSKEALSTLSPKQLGQLFDRLLPEYALGAVDHMSPLFSRLPTKMQTTLLAYAYTQTSSLIHACRTFAHQSQKQQKATREALQEKTSPGSGQEARYVEEFLKPANGSSSGPSLFSTLPPKTQRKLAGILPPLAAHLPQT